MMNISKKKKAEFDEIFKLADDRNFLIDVDLFKNLFESDFYDHFLLHVENKITNAIKTNDTLILHANINSLSIQDVCHYDRIISFAKILHKYTNNVKKIMLYGSSTIIVNCIKLINVALDSNINDKIFFCGDNLCGFKDFDNLCRSKNFDNLSRTKDFDDRCTE